MSSGSARLFPRTRTARSSDEEEKRELTSASFCVYHIILVETDDENAPNEKEHYDVDWDAVCGKDVGSFNRTKVVEGFVDGAAGESSFLSEASESVTMKTKLENSTDFRFCGFTGKSFIYDRADAEDVCLFVLLPFLPLPFSFSDFRGSSSTSTRTDRFSLSNLILQEPLEPHCFRYLPRTSQQEMPPSTSLAPTADAVLREDYCEVSSESFCFLDSANLPGWATGEE